MTGTVIVLVVGVTATTYVSTKMENDNTFDKHVKTNFPFVYPYFKLFSGYIPADIKKRILRQPTKTDTTSSSKSTDIIEDEAKTIPEVSSTKEISSTIIKALEDVDINEKEKEEELENISVKHETSMESELSDNKSIPNSVELHSVSPESKIDKQHGHNIHVTPELKSESVDLNTLPTVNSETIVTKLQQETISAALEEQLQQSLTLRKEIELSLLSDLHTLSNEQLKVRITQMASELFERAKWEGIRLHQAIRQVERDLSTKYSDLMKQQRIELENEMVKRLNLKEQTVTEEYTKLLKDTLAEKELQFERTIKTTVDDMNAKLIDELARQEKILKEDHQTELNNTIALLRDEHIRYQLKLQEEISSLHMQLKTYESMLDSIHSASTRSNSVHQSSAALLALEAALNDPMKPFKSEYNAAVKLALDESPVIKSALDSIPKSIIDKNQSPPSLQELRYRFRIVRKEMRREALSPPVLPGFLSSVVGTALATVSSPPEGLIHGDGLEEILARVSYYLERGELKSAVSELETLQGYPAILAKDWVNLAENRLIVDQALKVLKAYNIVSHVSIPPSQ
jgi:hypothetical protein